MIRNTAGSKIRLGLAGLGTVGRLHAANVLEGRVPSCELVAAADPSSIARDAFRDQFKVYQQSIDMIRAGGVDALLVAAPHLDHLPLGREAFAHDLHVMMEKPLGVHKADAQRLIDAHTDPTLVFAGMFNQRTDPAFGHIRQMIRAGELGQLRRIQWGITTWYRTEAYYASSPWRATWAGEGGGVLVNQLIHVLDLYQWLFGMPRRVCGFCQHGRYHDIEVEDDVTAFFQHADGLHATITTSTGEAPSKNRLEIHGERGRLTLENGRLEFLKNQVPMSEHTRSAAAFYQMPPAESVEVTVRGVAGHHAQMLQNFAEAILHGTPLLAPAAEGIHAVELANAIQYSSATDQTLTLPLDAAAYEQFLNDKIATSKPKQRVGVAVPPDLNPGRGMCM